MLRLPGTRPGKRRLLDGPRRYGAALPGCPADPPWAVHCPGRQTHRPGRRRSGRHGRLALGGVGNPPPRFAASATEFPLDRSGRDWPLRRPVRPVGTARPAATGVQFRRRCGRQGHRRRHRRLSHADPRQRRGQSCRRRAGEGRQRHRHRRPGHRPIAPRRLAWDGSKRTAAREPATSASSAAARPRTWSRRRPSCGPRRGATIPAFRRKIVRAIEQAFEKAARERPQRRRRLRPGADRRALDYESFRLSDDEPCVVAAYAAVRHCGAEPVRAISNGGLDANWLTARGIPTVTLGCGQENGHTVSERLDLRSSAAPAGLPCVWQPAASRSGRRGQDRLK